MDNSNAIDATAGKRLTLAEIGISIVILLAIAALAVVALIIPVAPPLKPEPESAFKVTGTTISIPEAAARRIGLETWKVRCTNEPVIARFTAHVGFNLDRLTHVKAQFAGRIADIGPALGSQVQGPKPGVAPSFLCAVESVDLGNAKNAYQKAMVQLTLDQEALIRTEAMIKENVLGPKFLLDAKAAVKKDEADVEAARQNLFVFGINETDLEKIAKEIPQQRTVYEIYSPLSGTIAEKNVTRGEFADNTVNLFTIAETSTMWVWGDVYEKDWGKVKAGQKMKVVLAAYPDTSLDSAIEFVSPGIDTSTRSIRVRGTLENARRKILSDMYGTLLVTVDEGKNSIIIPSVAVVRALKLGQSFVFVLRTAEAGQGASYERRAVVVEPVDIDRIRVIQGLSENDEIVTHGSLNLFEEMSH